MGLSGTSVNLVLFKPDHNSKFCSLVGSHLGPEQLGVLPGFLSASSLQACRHRNILGSGQFVTFQNNSWKKNRKRTLEIEPPLLPLVSETYLTLATDTRYHRRVATWLARSQIRRSIRPTRLTSRSAWSLTNQVSRISSTWATPLEGLKIWQRIMEENLNCIRLPALARYTIFQSYSSFLTIWVNSLAPFCQDWTIWLSFDTRVYLSPTISYSRINSLRVVSKGVNFLQRRMTCDAQIFNHLKMGNTLLTKCDPPPPFPLVLVSKQQIRTGVPATPCRRVYVLVDSLTQLALAT